MASPSVANYEAFGAQFEKILYFCCVGIESLFNKILSDNQLNIRNASAATFVRLKPHLRLEEYRLSLAHYPWLPELQPFGGWDASHSSSSLPWFGAYNSLKHDKKNSFHKATMRNALNAAAAYYILTFAVFGNQMFSGYFSEQFFFHFVGRPSWSPGELYFPPESGTGWVARPISI